MTTTKNEIQFDNASLNKVRFAYKCLLNKEKNQIINFIHKKGEVNVSTIYKTLKIEQSRTSGHLAMLREHGIVNARRQGKQVIYSLNYARIQFIHEKAKELTAKMAKSLAD